MNADEHRRQEWQAIIAKWQQSEKNMKTLCRENNIVYRTFFYWKNQLLPKKIEPLQKTSFVEIIDSSPVESGVTLEYQNVTLKLSKDFDPLTLSRCIKTLKEVS